MYMIYIRSLWSTAQIQLQKRIIAILNEEQLWDLVLKYFFLLVVHTQN